MRYSQTLLIALVIVAAAGKLALEPLVVGNQRQASLRLKPGQAAYHGDSLRRTSLGFDQLVGDLIWIKLLQSASHHALAPGEVSWEFAQVAAINRLDPNFQSAYRFGAIFLSVYRRDRLGAELVLRNWAKRRPAYWLPRWLLGYHLYFEMGRYEEASNHILHAAGMQGAPAYLAALGVRLLSEAGSLAQALQISVQLYNTLTDSEAKYRLRKRIRALRFELARSSWKEALASFRAERGREPHDLTQLLPYAKRTLRELSSLLETAETNEDLTPLLTERFSFRFDHELKDVVPTESAEALGIDRVGIYRPQGEM